MISWPCWLGTAVLAKPLSPVSVAVRRRGVGYELLVWRWCFSSGFHLLCVCCHAEQWEQMLSALRGVLRAWGVRSRAAPASLRPASVSPCLGETSERFPIAALLSSCPSPFQLGLGSACVCMQSQPSCTESLSICPGIPGFVLPIAALPRVSCGHENYPQGDAQTPLSWESAPAQPLQPLRLRVKKGRSSSRLSSCFPL